MPAHRLFKLRELQVLQQTMVLLLHGRRTVLNAHLVRWTSSRTWVIPHITVTSIQHLYVWEEESAAMITKALLQLFNNHKPQCHTELAEVWLSLQKLISNIPLTLLFSMRSQEQTIPFE